MKGRDVAGTGGCPGSDGAGWAGSAVHSSRLSHAGMSQHDSYVMAPTVPSNREHGSEAFPLLRESCWWLGGDGAVSCLFAVWPCCVFHLSEPCMRYQAQVQTQAWSNPAEGHRAWLRGIGGKEQAEPLWSAMSQLGLSALYSAGHQAPRCRGCTEAERGRRTWCLIFPSDSLKTAVPWDWSPPSIPQEGLGSGPPQCSARWRKRLFWDHTHGGKGAFSPPPSLTDSRVPPLPWTTVLGQGCESQEIVVSPQPRTILCFPQQCLFSQPALL